MKTLVMGDFHLGITLNEDLLNMQCDAFNFAIEKAIELKVDAIIQLGDIFDKRQNIDFKTLSIIRKVFQKLKDTKIPFIYVAGNHDFYYKNNNDLNSFRLLFEDNDNWKMVIDEAYVSEKMNCMFVPWINKENEKKLLSSIKGNKTDIILGHFPINGFEMVRGFTENHGIDPKLFKAKLTMSGHFHLRNENKKIVYAGSLTELNWNDYDDVKGIYILDMNKAKYEFIPHHLTLFKKIFIDDENFDIDVKEYNNKRVKLYVSIESSLKIEKLIAKLDEVSSKLEVIDNYTILKNMDASLETTSEDTKDIFKEYMETLTLTDEQNKGVEKMFSDIYSSSLAEMNEVE